MLLRPSESLRDLFLIVDSLFHTAEDFYFIYRLAAEAEIFFHKLLVDDRSADTHAHRTDLQIALASHRCSSDSSAAETKQLFLYVIRNLRNLIAVLDFMSIDAEGRKSLLSVSC